MFNIERYDPARFPLLLVFLEWLIEQEVRSEFLVLVAGKVGLDDELTVEAETAEL